VACGWSHQRLVPAGPDAPWRLQLMFADSSNSNWVFRRNPTIIRPLAAIGLSTTKGSPHGKVDSGPYLSPTALKNV
jgi:hypothetical protein